MPLTQNLPRDFGSPKRNVDNKLEDLKTPEQKNLESAQKNTIDFIKIIVATIKNQNPEKPADPGQIAQTMAVMKQTEEIMKMGGHITSLKDRLVSDELGRISGMYIGKNIHIDTSKQTFDGQNNVTFNYQLNYDEATKPIGACVTSSISIHNSFGLEVLKLMGKRDKGVHDFIWDGKDSKGKLLKKGEYTIKVNAHFENMRDGKLVKTPIDSGSYVIGKVDSVEMHGGKPKVRVEDKLFDLSQIIKITPQDTLENQEMHKLFNYSNYIGKIAEIENDNLEISPNGLATIEFQCDLPRPGKALIRLYDSSDDYVGCAVIENLQQGINNLSFKPTNSISPEGFESFQLGVNGGAYLKPGKYNYKIFTQNLLDEDSSAYKALESSNKYKITGLDFATEPLAICGNRKINISNIRRLLDDDGGATYNDYANYLGKVANVNFDTLELGINKHSEKRFIKIPYISDEFSLGDVYMNIYDSNNKNIAKVKSNTVINTQATSLYNKNTLFDYISSENLINVKANYQVPEECDTLDQMEEFFQSRENGKIEFSNFINELLGKLDTEMVARKYWHNFDSLSTNDKDLIIEAVKANSTLSSFQWDCRDFQGKRLNPGTYKYEFEIEKHRKTNYGNDGGLVVEKIYDKAQIQISEYTKGNDGEVKFYGKPIDSNGQGGENELMQFSLDQITSLRVA
ncbi:MAG: hypothetical protein EB127_13590 [Alphaproteobacteria bacterium]|nr:hypothetical protein [Alphaproteobacteria bacterium]